MSITTIRNSFTGYEATIRSASDYPAISTLKKHLRKSKANDCISTTTISCDGEGIEIADTGRGEQIVKTGQYSEA